MTFWVKFLGILCFIYVASALLFGLFPFNIVARVVTPTKIVQNYEWFYDMVNQIKTMDVQIEDSEMTLKTLTKDTELYNRNIVELNGLKRIMLNLISEYNSKSKQITRNLFKAKDLPYQINLKGEY